MIKTFRSSDKKGTEGIDFGEEWYKRLMTQLQSGSLEAIEREMERLRRFSDVMMRGPFMEEFGFAGKESHMLAMEFPMMIERTLMRTLEMKKAHSPARRKLQKSQQESEPGE